jgi:hypothetical protein
MTKAQGLRDVFGWNLPFEPQLVGPRLLDLLKRGGLLHEVGNCLRSRVRVSSLGDDLFLHSAFPTDAPDAVFFGPDTYRFANFIREELKTAPAGGVVVDVGAGAGAGAITAARRGRPSRLGAELIRSNGLDGLDCRADLIVANPPFIAGSDGHTYRDGGARHGAQLSLDWALSAVDRLNPGGRLLLYTGSAIVDGEDRFHTALATQIDAGRARIGYRELDPDIFGGMLGSEAYADVERIAAVGVVLTRS